MPNYDVTVIATFFPSRALFPDKDDYNPPSHCPGGLFFHHLQFLPLSPLTQLPCTGRLLGQRWHAAQLLGECRRVSAALTPCTHRLYFIVFLCDSSTTRYTFASPLWDDITSLLMFFLVPQQLILVHRTVAGALEFLVLTAGHLRVFYNFLANFPYLLLPPWPPSMFLTRKF